MIQKFIPYPEPEAGVLQGGTPLIAGAGSLLDEEVSESGPDRDYVLWTESVPRTAALGTAREEA